MTALVYLGQYNIVAYLGSCNSVDISHMTFD